MYKQYSLITTTLKLTHSHRNIFQYFAVNESNNDVIEKITRMTCKTVKTAPMQSHAGSCNSHDPSRPFSFTA